MNSLKKLAVGISTAAILLTSVSPVLGATKTSNTGITDHSYARSEAYDNDVHSISNTTVGVRFTNWDVALATSGFVSQSDNEDDNTAVTSGAGAEYETANFANVNETKFAESNGAEAANANVNDHSGDPCGDTCECCDGSSCGGTCGGICATAGQCPDPCGCPAACPVTAIADDSDTFTVDNTNRNTGLFNVTASVAISGVVSQSGNEDLNKVTTGVALSGAYASNVVNNNYSEFGGAGTGTKATNTGITDHSYATAQALDKDVVGVSNTNANTSVTNVTAAVSISGLVDQSDNEDQNEATTNRAEAATATENYVNVNETKVNVDSNVEATNSNVDDHSSAQAVADDSDTVSVTNVNRDTNVFNVSAAVAISGGVKQNCNEDTNKVTTGPAVATGKTMNVINGNQTYVE